ncbi:MAG TPA: hypothetical protein VI757_04145 [Bacteroidia bacterium]|nr:hypothetical protein [Bacteroidia bacterium]
MEKRKRGMKNAAVMAVHTGKLLEEKIKEQRLSKAEVARRIVRPRTAIKPLCARPSMQAYLLWELSVALGYDFFAHLSQALLQKHPAIAGINNASATIAALEKENERLNIEIGVLERMRK